jgi:hypothetical protein
MHDTGLMIGSRDANELAHNVFLESIGEAPKTEPPVVRPKNPAAAALGRVGRAERRGSQGRCARTKERLADRR